MQSVQAIKLVPKGFRPSKRVGSQTGLNTSRKKACSTVCAGTSEKHFKQTRIFHWQ